MTKKLYSFDITDITPAFYERLNTSLKRKKITRKKLCEDLDISYNTLSAMIKRKSRTISYYLLEELSSYLDVSFEYLLHGDQTETPYEEIVFAPMSEEHNNKIIEQEKKQGIHRVTIGFDNEIRTYKLKKEQIESLLVILSSMEK